MTYFLEASVKMVWLSVVNYVYNQGANCEDLLSRGEIKLSRVAARERLLELKLRAGQRFTDKQEGDGVDNASCSLESIKTITKLADNFL